MLQRSKNFLIFSGLILLFILIIENVNQRFWLNDFKVYYLAAEAFLTHQPVYGEVFGESTGFYKYSPVLLYLFAPATAFGFFTAAIVHYLITCVALCTGLLVTVRLISEETNWKIKNPTWVLTFSFIALLNHFFRELHLGNVNAILVSVLVSAFYLYRRKQTASAAFGFALCLLFKPYFILLLIPFLITRQWRLILYGLAWLAGLIALFFVVRGPAEALSLHKAWFASMLDHNVMLQSANTVPFLIGLLVGAPVPALLVSGITFVLLLSCWYFLSKKLSSTFSEFFLFVSLLALLPNLLITDTEHFLFSYPLIVFLIFYGQNADRVFRLALIGVLVMYGANSPEIFGTEVSDALEHHGMLGAANLLLVIMSFWVMRKGDFKMGGLHE